MDEQVYRVMALGDGETLDKMVACLTFEGFVVAQVSDQGQAERLLKRGGIDAVVADAGAEALGSLLPKKKGDRPWVVLGTGEAGPIPEDRAMVLAVPVSSDTLCIHLKALIADSVKARAQRRKKRLKERQLQV
jgi:hypothetical protein